MSASTDRILLPSIAVAFSGAVWGMYWIPIRQLDLGGVPPYWATLFSFGLVGILSCVAFFIQWVRSGRMPWSAIRIGLITGLAIIFYATALVLTDVMKTILLFYLLPVWGTILGKVMLKETVTWQRVTAVILGLAGLAVILDVSEGFPRPSNAGDWIALASGMLWAYASIKIRQNTTVTAWEQVGGFYVGGGLISAAAVLFPFGIFSAAPSYESIIQSSWWLLIFIGVYLPSMFLIFWGTQRLSPARAGILLMTEIVFGALTAALWANEPFGWLRLLGVILIGGAALVELSGKVETATDKAVESA